MLFECDGHVLWTWLFDLMNLVAKKKKKKSYLHLNKWTWLRATTSMVAKSYKIQKVVHFTHYDQKNTHINGCKIVHKCKSATVTVHIYTVIVALHLIFYYFFLSTSPHSLFFSLVHLTLTSLSFYLWSLTLTSLISKASHH